MSDDNKRNLLFFEAASMRHLYEDMREWQVTNQKRFLSLSIQNDCGKFYCIALTNPGEVVITDRSGNVSVRVDEHHNLCVYDGHV